MSLSGGMTFVLFLRGIAKKGVRMKMRFTLTMEDLVVDSTRVDNMIIDWIDDVSQAEVLEMSHQWITSKNFLTERMVGLKKVGESSLTIEPVDEGMA
jgi:hypothetical protein